MNKKDKIIYWVFTVPFVLLMLMSALTYLSGSSDIVNGFAHLGYPAYLIKILATAKILGALAILFSPFNFLKEWAYAGFAINCLGASASHAFSGDDMVTSLMPLVILSVMLVSYAYWKKTTLQLQRRRA